MRLRMLHLRVQFAEALRRQSNSIASISSRATAACFPGLACPRRKSSGCGPVRRLYGRRQPHQRRRLPEAGMTSSPRRSCPSLLTNLIRRNCGQSALAGRQRWRAAERAIASANEPSKDIARLIEIMAALRAENGCPWDIEQDCTTIAPYTIEEATRCRRHRARRSR